MWGQSTKPYSGHHHLTASLIFENGSFLELRNSVIFGPIRLFHTIFGNVRASRSILDTFQVPFPNEKLAKKASEVGGREVAKYKYKGAMRF